MFFVDKYSPQNCEESAFHEDIIKKLDVISKDNSTPHIIFHGEKGSGKKTLARLFMEKLFGKSINRCYNTPYSISGSGNSPTEVFIKQSRHHIVIEPNNTNFDRYLIHEVVKKYAKSNTVDLFIPDKKIFKIVLISNIDRLSYYAQTSLRRTMEKYSKNCKFIMLSHSLSKVINPLISRCMCIRVKSPSDNKIFKRVHDISIKEDMNLELDTYQKIVKRANGNIKKALWNLNMLKFDIHDETIYTTTIDNIVNLLYTHGVNSIIEIRKLLYKIIITNINCTQIIIDMLDVILLNDELFIENKYKIINFAAKYENSLVKGRHKIIHLDALIQNIINVIHENKKKLYSQNNNKSNNKCNKSESICAQNSA